jgi:hypothetical protein
VLAVLVVTRLMILLRSIIVFSVHAFGVNAICFCSVDPIYRGTILQLAPIYSLTRRLFVPPKHLLPESRPKNLGLVLNN